MKQRTLEKLTVPGNSDDRLILKSDDLENGVLSGGGRDFPITDGIPRLLAPSYDAATSCSFSAEWGELFPEDDVWGEAVQDRIKKLAYLELPVEKLRGLDFLDAGCGNGLFAKAVALNFAAEVTAMDISTGLETAKKASRNGETVDFVQADMRYPPFASNSFDIIWCDGSLYHTPDPRFTFGQLVRLLKKGGLIFCWLYTPLDKMTFRLAARRFTKNMVSRCRGWLQDILISTIACFTITKQFIIARMLKKEPRVPFVPKLRHHRMMARDTYTVKYDWHLTIEEVLSWHRENRLSSVYVRKVLMKDGYWLAALAKKP